MQQSVGALLVLLDRAASTLSLSPQRPLFLQAATAIRGLVYQLVETQAQLQTCEDAIAEADARLLEHWNQNPQVKKSKPS